MSLDARFCLLLEAESQLLGFLRLCYWEVLVAELLAEVKMRKLLTLPLNVSSKLETANMVRQATSFLSDPRGTRQNRGNH